MNFQPEQCRDQETLLHAFKTHPQIRGKGYTPIRCDTPAQHFTVARVRLESDQPIPLRLERFTRFDESERRSVRQIQALKAKSLGRSFTRLSTSISRDVSVISI
jgi:hypothetical protein